MPLDSLPSLGVRQHLAAVDGSLLFLEPSAEKPYSYNYDPPEGVARTNTVYTPYLVSIADARPIADTLSLDVDGFVLARHGSAVTDFHDDAQAGSTGRSEAGALVAEWTGASRVVVFDHTVRRRAPDAARQPSNRAHNDYTEGSGPQRVRDLMAGEADTLLRGRVAFINVWRPIRWPAQDWPLALCDARSVAQDDLIASDLVYPDRRGETYAVAYAPDQRWSYFPAMQLDEAVLIKCYDSERDVARFAAHTAFQDPKTPADAPPRESIEFRTIAFF